MTSYFEVYDDQQNEKMSFGPAPRKAPTRRLTRSVLSELTQNTTNRLKRIAKSDGRDAILQKICPQTSTSKQTNHQANFTSQNQAISLTTPLIQESIQENLDPVATSAPLLVKPDKEDDLSSSGVSVNDDSNDSYSSVFQDTIYLDDPTTKNDALEDTIDLDEPTTKNDALAVPEYSAEIHKYLKEREAKAMPKRNYMEKQRHISFSMRAILVNWMAEVALEYKLDTQTLYLAVSYVDRFLSLMMVEKTKLQLVGTAAMFVAAKYEEVYPPSADEFAFITDDTYSRKQVLRMEDLMLKVLKFNISLPTIHDFLHDYSRMFSMDGTCLHLARYLSELSLLDGETFLKFRPSVVAASSVVLARHTLRMEAWSGVMAAKMGFCWEDLKECVDGLHKAFEAAPTLDQQDIQTKYKDLKFSCVADLDPVNI